MDIGKIITDDDIIESQFYTRSGILAHLPAPYRQFHILERIKGYWKEMHSHNFYQLIFVTSGTLEIITEKSSHTLRNGQAAVIAPHTPHALSSPEGYSQLGIDIFNQSDSRGLVSLLRKTFPEGTAIEFTTFSIDIDSFYKQMYMQMDLNSMKLVNKAEALVLDVIEQASEINDDFSSRFVKIISDDGYLKSLEDISNRMNMSVTHLERMVNRYFSCSAKALCQRMRLEKSCILLENTNLPIKMISEKLGFYDESHFMRAFKKYLGLTPAQYRNNSTVQQTKT